MIHQNSAVAPAAGFTCWDGYSGDSLASALTAPVTECMEAALIDGHQYSQLVFRPRLQGCLRLAVTTRSAYRHQVAKSFTAALAARLELSEDLRDRIHTTVHEAIMNSILHGNLAVGSTLRNSLEELSVAHRTIDSLLEAPQIARQMIRVEAIWSTRRLYILVRDSGAGFKRGEPKASSDMPDASQRSGRGMAILDAFCDHVSLQNGGSTIKLRFSL